MAKKMVLIMLMLVIGLGIYFGALAYREARNTPEASMTSFMEALATGDVQGTYERFSAAYASTYAEDSWQTYLNSIKESNAPEFISSNEVVDRFNVYAPGSNPQRFMYSMQVKGRQYWVSTVILKEDGSWKIDDFQGSYKQ